MRHQSRCQAASTRDPASNPGEFGSWVRREVAGDRVLKTTIRCDASGMLLAGGW